ncbi:MAG: tetratricopeptide repeat protein [Pirellulales bacterium]|nr:tetratricopeptide repeat protein [Pirellulales bacterium]
MSKRSWQFATAAALAGMVAWGTVLAWRWGLLSFDRDQVTELPAADTPSSGDPPAGSVSWQPAAKPGPHPLLGNAEQVVWASEGRVRSTVDPKLGGLIRALRKDQPSGGRTAPLKIDYPLNESIFPPEIVAPTFLWHESAAEADTWLIEVAFAGRSTAICVLSPGRPPPDGEIDPECLGENNEVYQPTPYQAGAHGWTPGADVWRAIKNGCCEQPAVVTICGFQSGRPDRVLSRGQTTMTTSKDPVGAPIFYRDVPLMPSKGEKGIIQPLAKQAIPLITWRLRDVARQQSRVVLRDMPTCANCHSFSADGRTLGMDVDGPEGDKGAYTIVPVSRRMAITPETVITWNSFPGKPAGGKTIGFMSQVSPDGQHVVTTVNEQIYVANFLQYEFLQVFYPTAGILAYYDCATEEMKPLPGADDPDYVHCSSAWSPDGQYIVFCRAKAIDPYPPGRAAAEYAGDSAELPIQYDLYRIPFTGGHGGRCEPIAGASNNGMSNTFPKVSPDGKYIVFVKCRNGQLMRPDGKLWIVPASGGEARPMRCNTRRMNSWHSFSPNGRWMVFSSKADTPYTQMFLTHLDEHGNDSPAILVPRATAANRAVNIPEFVNVPYDDLVEMAAPAVEYFRHFNSGRELAKSGQHLEAVAEFQKALAGEPDDWRINAKLAESLLELGRVVSAQEHFRKALLRNPGRPMLHNKMALALIQTKQHSDALQHLNAAIHLSPELALAWCNRGNLRMQAGDPAGAEEDFSEAIRLDAGLARAWCGRANLRLARRDFDGALEDYTATLEADPTLALAWCNRGNLRVSKGDAQGAMEDFNQAIELVPGFVVARCNRGTLRMQNGDPSGALEDFNAALQHDPRHAEAWYGRAAVRKAQEDWQAAAADLGECLGAAAPDWPHRTRVEAELREVRRKL